MHFISAFAVTCFLFPITLFRGFRPFPHHFTFFQLFIGALSNFPLCLFPEILKCCAVFFPFSGSISRFSSSLLLFSLLSTFHLPSPFIPVFSNFPLRIFRETLQYFIILLPLRHSVHPSTWVIFCHFHNPVHYRSLSLLTTFLCRISSFLPSLFYKYSTMPLFYFAFVSVCRYHLPSLLFLLQVTQFSIIQRATAFHSCIFLLSTAPFYGTHAVLYLFFLFCLHLDLILTSHHLEFAVLLSL